MTQTVVYYCNSGDAWANKNNDFSATGSQIYMVDDPSATNSNVRSYFPFTVNLRNVNIEQAWITVRSSYASDSASGTIRFHCEATDNSTTPTSGSDLNGRSLSSYYADHVIGGFALNEDRTWQIDNPIQETLQRAGWKSGNVLAVIVFDVDLGDSRREVYSYEGNFTYRARLTINFTDNNPMVTGVY